MTVWRFGSFFSISAQLHDCCAVHEADSTPDSISIMMPGLKNNGTPSRSVKKGINALAARRRRSGTYARIRENKKEACLHAKRRSLESVAAATPGQAMAGNRTCGSVRSPFTFSPLLSTFGTLGLDSKHGVDISRPFHCGTNDDLQATSSSSMYSPPLSTRRNPKLVRRQKRDAIHPPHRRGASMSTSRSSKLPPSSCRRIDNSWDRFRTESGKLSWEMMESSPGKFTCKDFLFRGCHSEDDIENLFTDHGV